MCALPSKDTSEERDEPLASEDEVEHEEDSLDVELWRNKLVAWEATEVVRRRKKFAGKFRAQKQFSHRSSREESDEEDEETTNDVPVRQSCLLVLDSLGGNRARQARLCGVLREFLTMEFQAKYPGQEKEFTTKTIPGCAPKVPQQPNLTDCGIYVCHNVETFFRTPIQDFTMPITSLRSWFPDSEPRVKRRDIAQLIRSLATEQNQ